MDRTTELRQRLRTLLDRKIILSDEIVAKITERMSLNTQIIILHQEIDDFLGRYKTL